MASNDTNGSYRALFNIEQFRRDAHGVVALGWRTTMVGEGTLIELFVEDHIEKRAIHF